MWSSTGTQCWYWGCWIPLLYIYSKCVFKSRVWLILPTDNMRSTDYGVFTYGMLTMGFTMGSYQLLSYQLGNPGPAATSTSSTMWPTAFPMWPSLVRSGLLEVKCLRESENGVRDSNFLEESVIIHQVPYHFSTFWGRSRRSSLFLVTTICSQLVRGSSNGGSPGLGLAVGKCVFTFLLTIQISS